MFPARASVEKRMDKTVRRKKQCGEQQPEPETPAATDGE